MTVWAFKDPTGDHFKKYVVQCLDNGESRFGWAYADLRILAKKKLTDMTEQEKLCWKKSRFLLEVKTDDWVVHVNIPEYGQCAAAKVVGDYDFKLDPTLNDFGHCFPIDASTKVVFNRNDARLHERVSQNLKPRQRFQRVKLVKEFFDGLHAIKAGVVVDEEGERKATRFFRDELKPQLSAIAEMIHRNYPNKKLEYFVKDLFDAIPGVTSVVVNGSRWGPDYGADVIVTYTSGLPIATLGTEQTLVVQVKSFMSKMEDQTAIEQIKTAIQKFDADAGMIFSTAEASDEFKEKVEELNRTSDVPVLLIAGDDVARFVLKYGGALLFDV